MGLVITALGLGALGAAAVVALWVVMTAEFGRTRKAQRAAMAVLEAGRAMDQANFAAMEESVKRLERLVVQSQPSSASKSRLNFSLRSQVIRMHKEGVGAPEIASRVKLSPNEVRLILKIYDRLMASPTEVGAG